MLKRTDAKMIKRMRRQGLYLKDIAAQLGCSERTVRRTLQRGGPASGRRPGARGSKLDPYKPMIDAMLSDGIWNCRVIRARLQAAGYDGGSTLVEDYVRPLRRLQPSKATVRFETPPGRQLQHDWGEIDAEVYLAGRGTTDASFRMKRDHLSPAYTTRWADLPIGW